MQLSQPLRTHKKSGPCHGRLLPLRHLRSRLLQEVKTALSDGRKQPELVEVNYAYCRLLQLHYLYPNETRTTKRRRHLLWRHNGLFLGETAGDASSVNYSSSVRIVSYSFKPAKVFVLSPRKELCWRSRRNIDIGPGHEFAINNKTLL